MSNAEVIEFEKIFEIINLDLMKNNAEKYDMAILVVYALEINRGCIVKKQSKTTKKGTKFTYKVCNDEAEAEAYRIKLDELICKYNEKYKTNYCW